MRVPQIDTLILECANKTYVYTIPQTVKEFTLTARFGNSYRLSYEQGGQFVTIPEKTSKTLKIDLQKPFDIFISSNVHGEVIELELWK